MKYWIFLISILILSSLVMASGHNLNKMNSDSIIKDFEGGAKKVKVVLKMDDDFGIHTKRAGDVSGKAVPRYVSKEVSLQELEALQFDPTVENIFSEYHLHAFLGESVGIIESNLANDLKFNTINLTGTGQVVCVIDSGINFSHPDLLGKNASCIVDCFNKTCVENCSLGDDYGHGTHVAGIVAASGGITGIAPNVSLIGVKILDSSGKGSDNISDFKNAVDWCVSNNANVITMSFGTTTLYGSECDSVIPLWSNSINVAVAQNITVIAASGNEANYTHISAPACMSNAIAVGDTYDADIGNNINWIGVCTDATTALDKIVCHANRNSLVKLFAPGALINSTKSIGGYIENGGTSMAAPMVAGAVAIINQYLDLSSQTKTPGEIEDILNDTGVVLDDGANSGNNYSRINVYSALLSLDVDAPNVTLVSPVNNNVNLTSNQTFVCNATDWQLANITLKIWNSTGLYHNETANLTGIANETNFSLTDMPFGNYDWNCLAFDNQSNSAYASSNYSLTIGGIEVELNSPPNATYTNSKDTNFTCTSTSDFNYELANVTFYLWNSSEVAIYNLTKNISGFDNDTLFNYTFSLEDSYSWSCLGVNNGSNESWADSNFSITYDVTNPKVSLVGALPNSETSNSVSKSFGFNVSDDNLANCSLIVNDVINLTNSSMNQSINQTFSQTFTPGTYVWSINCSDFAENKNSSSSNSFVIISVPTTGTSSSGGGGGGGGVATDVPKVYEASVSDVSSGYTKSLKKNEKINFSLFDFSGGRHLLTVGGVGSDYVNLTIESDPINFTLGVGQSIKLNLTSVNYYDLFVKLNNITSSSAELTIQLINEPIESVVVVEKEVVKEKTIEGKDYFWIVIVLVVILALIVFVVIMTNRSARGAPSSGKELKGSKTDKKNGRKNKKTKT